MNDLSLACKPQIQREKFKDSRDLASVTVMYQSDDGRSKMGRSSGVGWLGSFQAPFQARRKIFIYLLFFYIHMELHLLQTLQRITCGDNTQNALITYQFQVSTTQKSVSKSDFWVLTPVNSYKIYAFK